MRRFRLPLRFFLKRAGNVITKYARPALRSEVLGRGLTLWGRIVIRPLALTSYQKHWRRDSIFGGLTTNRRHISYLKIYSNHEISDRIKELFLRNTRYSGWLRSQEVPNRLEDYDIGSNIACGCNAAVYEARVRTLEKTDKPKRNICANSPSTSDSVQKKQTIVNDPVVAFPYALKIMFNYEYDAPERHLWIDMGTELVPLLDKPPELIGYMAKKIASGKAIPVLGSPGYSLETYGMVLFDPAGTIWWILRDKSVTLPVDLTMSFLPRTHPNIVQMYKAFTDRMPVLADARRLYPEALPTADFYELIDDEPKTLFIVMKRYRMTLREYVLTHKRNYWFGRVMFGQLLEALVYLYDHRISHRDMKSDNVLLDFDTDDDVPHLVLSDFGCALATGTWRVRYDTDTVDLGGNMALRAPEIRRARPAFNTWVDFRLADLWAAATLGYEIFTRTNPFHSRMKSDQYAECELPPLPRRMHCAIRALIHDMLRIDPNMRPIPHIAANVLSISLFRFGDNLQKFFHDCGFEETLFGRRINELRNASSKTLKVLGQKMTAAVNDFTMLFATETILARNIHPNVISAAELQLRATFLSRLDREQIWSALNYFYPDNDDDDNDLQHDNYNRNMQMKNPVFAGGDAAMHSVDNATNSVNNLVNNSI